VRILILLICILLVCSCKNDFARKKSGFKLQNDLTDFSKKMENGDTLIIIADLSVCQVNREEKSVVTKKNNEIFITTSIKSNLINEIDTQLKTKVYHRSEKDSLNFEDLFKYMKKKGSQDRQTNSEIFTVNYNQQETSFFSDGLTDKLTIIEYYSKIMKRINPDVKFYQPPKILEFVAPKLISDSAAFHEMDSAHLKR
jgi:hypothetical protein